MLSSLIKRGGIIFFIVLAISACGILDKPVESAEADESTIVKKQQKSSGEDEIFTVVEDSPSFPGGRDSLLKYIKQNIQYPESALENEIEGTVYVTFVVEKDGSLSNEKVLRGINQVCDEEALRLVRDMPAWQPGLHRGEPMRVQYNMPVKFELPQE